MSKLNKILLHLLSSQLLFPACICLFLCQPLSYLPPTESTDSSECMCVAASKRPAFPTKHCKFLNNRCPNQGWLTHAQLCTHKNMHVCHTLQQKYPGRCGNTPRQMYKHICRQSFSFSVSPYLVVDIILRMQNSSRTWKKKRNNNIQSE